MASLNTRVRKGKSAQRTKRVPFTCQVKPLCAAMPVSQLSTISKSSSVFSSTPTSEYCGSIVRMRPFMRRKPSCPATPSRKPGPSLLYTASSRRCTSCGAFMAA